MNLFAVRIIIVADGLEKSAINKKPHLIDGVFVLTLNGFLRNHSYVCSLEAFRSLLNFKLYFVTLIECLVAIAGDCFEVDEYIFAALT